MSELQDVGPPAEVKKPTRLGSMSPAHVESCKDLEQFVERGPTTPQPDPNKDDKPYSRKIETTSCLEQAELRQKRCLDDNNVDSVHANVAETKSSLSTPTVSKRSSGSVLSAYRAAGCDKPLEPMCSKVSVTPSSSARRPSGTTKDVCAPNPEKSLCSPIPESLSSGIIAYKPPELEVSDTDHCDGFPSVFDDDVLCSDVRDSTCSPVRARMKQTPCQPPSPFRHLAAGGQKVCHEPLKLEPIPEECVRFRSPPPCAAAKTLCQPLFDQLTEPSPQETSAEYITLPMKLPVTKPAEFLDMKPDSATLFAV